MSSASKAGEHLSMSGKTTFLRLGRWCQQLKLQWKFPECVFIFHHDHANVYRDEKPSPTIFRYLNHMSTTHIEASNNFLHIYSSTQNKEDGHAIAQRISPSLSADVSTFGEMPTIGRR